MLSFGLNVKGVKEVSMKTYCVPGMFTIGIHQLAIALLETIFVHRWGEPLLNFVTAVFGLVDW